MKETDRDRVRERERGRKKSCVVNSCLDIYLDVEELEKGMQCNAWQNDVTNDDVIEQLLSRLV